MTVINYQNQFPIKYIPLGSSSFQIPVLSVGLLEFLFVLLNILLNRKRIYNFFSPENHAAETTTIDAQQEKIVDDQNTHVSSGADDVEIVLRSLGMSYNSEETKFPARLDDIASVFEEKNASLDEVKEAFDVFDSNRDGFIDAFELHKVFCAMGFKESLEIEKCRRMIRVFDENDDGRIDFDEFVKVMESSFC